MVEKVIIKDFSSIKYAEIDLNAVNVFIGAQTSGKSVIAKLLYFFKNFFHHIYKSVEDDLTKREIDKNYLLKFESYFPKETWHGQEFEITYLINQTTIELSKKNGKSVKFWYSDHIKNLTRQCRLIFVEERGSEHGTIPSDIHRISKNTALRYNNYLVETISPVATFNQLFIPAGRSFYANLQSGIFSFLSNNSFLDPFMIEFGSFYENIKRTRIRDAEKPEHEEKMKLIDKYIYEILKGKYLREKDKDFLVHNDGRKVNLSYASSGQQETLPLMIILRSLPFLNISAFGTTLYIEEPEAHLFPNAQKTIVELLALVLNSKVSGKKFQIVVTTHSPYILAAFNNLMQAGRVEEKLEGVKLKKLYKILPKEGLIKPNNLYAYALSKGTTKNLISKSTQLISQNALDAVSDEIAIQFDQLLDLEY